MEGYLCPRGTYNPHYGATGISWCIPCSGGHSCTLLGLTAPNGGCDPGHYCYSGADTPAPLYGSSIGNQCPIGHSCPENSTLPIPCANGTFTNETGTVACYACPAGSFCVDGINPQPCRPGYYCPSGTGHELQPCPSGTFNPHYNLSAEVGCLRCAPGKYCEGIAVSEEGASGDCAAGFYCLEGVNTSIPLNYYSGMGGVCPAGFWCPEGSSVPIPCPVGTFSNDTGLSDVSDCLPCTPGMYCASLNLTAPTGNCHEGYVCIGNATAPNPTESTTGYPCIAGYYCPEGTSTPLLCLPGTYNPLTAQGECFECPEGFYCLEGTMSFNNSLCPVGHYCPNGTRHAHEYPCPAGTYGNTEGLRSETDCNVCPPGYYCTGGRPSPDGMCAAGWYCSIGATTSQPIEFGTVIAAGNSSNNTCYCSGIGTGGQCFPGHYCPQGSERPLACPSGMYCSGFGMSTPSAMCQAGYFCQSGATVSNPTDYVTGYPCPEGHYCEMGTTDPVPCSRGMYSNVTGGRTSSDCFECPPGMYCSGVGLTQPTGLCSAGYYCPGGMSVPSDVNYICPSGHYCPEGSAAPLECDEGTYQNNEGQSVCSMCQAGFYCPLKALTSFIDYSCPAGYYCPSGTSSANQYGCPLGTYGIRLNMRTVSECQSCPSGRYCGVVGLNNSEGSGPCAAGYFCDSGASQPNPPNESSGGGLCPAGFYCPEGTGRPISCPLGTYSPDTGLANESECRSCLPGHYCGSINLTTPSGLCQAGYYCLGGSSTPTPLNGTHGDQCKVGHYCPEGSNQSLPCGPGTYSSQPLAIQCDLCPPGRYCLDGIDPFDCPSGFYCPLGTGYDLKPCPSGTFSPHTRLSSSDECTVCLAGHYCSDLNSTTTTGICEAGYYCTAGSNSPTPDGINSTGTAGPCPVGHFCPPATSNPQPCPRGTFSNKTHLNSSEMCTQCPLGYYCESSGLSSPTGPCSGGHYCLEGSYTATPNGAQLTGDVCPKGHYCPTGSSRPLTCDAGTHNPDLGRDQCFPCLEGFYCPNNSTESDLSCPAGYYCPEGTQFFTQYPCPKGYYNDRTERKSLEDCKPCPPGMYCDSIGLNSPSGDCDSGWYCTLASSTARPIQSVYDNAADNDSCTNSTGGECQPGFYCPEGSSSPLPCLGGYYCDRLHLANVSGPCDPGYYCRQQATTATPLDGTTGDICPPGYYCPEASTSPFPCPLGTFSNNTGNSHLDNCTGCLEGYACSQLGLSTPNEICSEGYYCPTGQQTSKPPDFICPLGHKCPEGSATSVLCESGQYQDVMGSATCKICPEGYFCDGFLHNGSDCALGVSQPMPCPAGSYCPEGTIFARQFLCPEGTFSPSLYLTNVTQCLNCSGGYYCSGAGLTMPTDVCTAGYYCISGAVTGAPTDGITGNQCPTGYYCPPGAQNPTACPPGTFNPTSRATNNSFCLKCTSGHFCEGYGLSSTSGLCNASYYCTESATSFTPSDLITGGACPVGHFCSAGSSAPIPCPEGKYINQTYSQSCNICPAGMYCTGEGTVDPLPCPAGYVCPAGTGVVSQRCPLGRYSPFAGLADVSECISCDPGHYCDDLGQTSVSGTCDAGFYCVSGSTNASPDTGVCPAGSYCPEGSIAPQRCPQGTYSNLLQATSLANCTACSPGRFCETEGLTEPTNICAAGYYCTSGAIVSRPDGLLPNSGPCPIGHYCPPETATPMPCDAGSYTNDVQQETCDDCPSGYYCPQSTSDYTVYLCAPGHYCPTGTEHSQQYPCPQGTYHNMTGARNSAACQACPSGHYCDAEGLTSPTGLCSPGWYCTGLAQSSTPMSSIVSLAGDTLQCSNVSTGAVCPTGNYCPEGSSMPTPCTPGYYCNTTGLSSTTGQCSAGHYCNGSSPVSTPIGAPYGNICPSGFYCPEGTASPIHCPVGTFSASTSNTHVNSCLQCTGGQYCSSPGLSAPNGICSEGVYCPPGQNSSEGIPCPAGSYCPGGTAVAVPCESGSYQPLMGQSMCFECPAGYYCDMNEAITNDTNGVVTPVICPQGFFCPNGTQHANSYPCPDGTFGNSTGLQTEAECSDCLNGYYCGSDGTTQPTGKCFAGFVCVLGSSTPQPNGADMSVGYPCPQGTYCVEGSTAPQFCPVGTYNNRTQLASIDECSLCLPGQFCDVARLVLPSGNCLQGYYCILGSSTPTPTNDSIGNICPRGYFCPEGSSQPQPCNVGYYQPELGATSVNDCLSCNPGMYCSGTGLVAPSGNCSSGYYCSSAAKSAQPLANSSAGGICPLGHQCPPGSSAPEPCRTGTYSNITGAELCFICPAGYSCTNSITADQCSPGFYCPAGTGFDQQPCPRGTYNPAYRKTNQSDCLTCDPGMYCGATSLSAPSGNCSAGYYCTAGVDTPIPTGVEGIGGLCPIGSYCPEASFQPIPCQQGTYNELTGQSSCLDCPQGYYCPENTSDYSIYPCPIGYYCPTGTEHSSQYPCPRGTYNNRTNGMDIDDCLLCPPGKYCDGEGLSTFSGDCSEGYYCVKGSDSATPSAASNATLLSECSCPLVPYIGGSCWPGYYCPTGTAYPLSCPSGMFCNASILSAPSGVCEAGYWCPGNITHLLHLIHLVLLDTTVLKEPLCPNLVLHQCIIHQLGAQVSPIVFLVYLDITVIKLVSRPLKVCVQRVIIVLKDQTALLQQCTSVRLDITVQQAVQMPYHVSQEATSLVWVQNHVLVALRATSVLTLVTPMME